MLTLRSRFGRTKYSVLSDNDGIHLKSCCCYTDYQRCAKDKVNQSTKIKWQGKEINLTVELQLSTNITYHIEVVNYFSTSEFV